MVVLLIFLYLNIGGAAAFGYKYLSCLWNIHFDEDCGTVVAVVSGIFWPLVAPFSFAVITAVYYAENHD